MSVPSTKLSDSKEENMIYRFHTKQVGSQSPMEVQVQAPADKPVDELILGLRESFSHQGIELESLLYVGSVDTDFMGLVVPAKEFATASNPSEEWPTVTFDGDWYSLIDDTPAMNTCVVAGCGRKSSFHLCKTHALPGLLGKVSGKNFVFSFWLVERAGQMLLITLSDFAVGTLFGGRQGFEHQLGIQGYKIHGLISSEEEFITQQQRPGIRIIPWTKNLPEGENDLPRLK
jgi:hypothetical protein